MAATMLPQVLSVIQVTFPVQERSAAFGMYGAFAGLATVAGPLLGGLLIHLDVLGLQWRTIFLINVPIGLVALAGAGVLVPESRASGGQASTCAAWSWSARACCWCSTPSWKAASSAGRPGRSPRWQRRSRCLSAPRCTSGARRAAAAPRSYRHACSPNARSLPD